MNKYSHFVSLFILQELAIASMLLCGMRQAACCCLCCAVWRNVEHIMFSWCGITATDSAFGWLQKSHISATQKGHNWIHYSKIEINSGFCFFFCSGCMHDAPMATFLSLSTDKLPSTKAVHFDQYCLTWQAVVLCSLLLRLCPSTFHLRTFR